MYSTAVSVGDDGMERSVGINRGLNNVFGTESITSDHCVSVCVLDVCKKVKHERGTIKHQSITPSFSSL